MRRHSSLQEAWAVSSGRSASSADIASTPFLNASAAMFPQHSDKSAMALRVLHIAETWQGASGVATFVRELDASLRARGVESKVCEHEDQVGHSDVLHIHGLWLMMFHRAAQWAIKNDIPIVWSTHGMTAPWSMRHKWWKKVPAWSVYQKWDLRKAAMIHCTAEQEVEWNISLGFRNCFIAPLGTRLPPIVGVSSSSSRDEETFHSPTPTHNSNYTLLFVGRIYPVKGLVNLIKAWKLVQTQVELNHPFSNSNSELELNHHWELRIIGPDQAGHQSELESLVRELNLGDSVEFAGPKFGDELSAEYDNCDCLVLPSFTENFGATIVDALAHGKPCIASTFTPWRELQEYGCGWWVPNEPKPLAIAIMEMVSLDDSARRNIGDKGRMLVEEKYTWNVVVKKIIAEYEYLLD